MGKLHPTCHTISLQLGAKIIALIDMTLGLIGIVWFVYMLGRYDIISLEPFEEPSNNAKVVKLDSLGEMDVPTANNTGKRLLSTNQKAISLTLSSTFTIVNLVVFVILLVGAHRKSIALCLAWFYIRSAVIVFKVIIFFMYLVAGRPLFSQIPHIVNVLIHIYGLWLVNAFVEELRGINYQRGADEQSQGPDDANAPQATEEQTKKDKKRRRSENELTVNGIEKLQKKREDLYKQNPHLTDKFHD